jgi:hypothetical protein
MKKNGAALSPVVPGKYFAFVERVVCEHYQTQVVDADNEDDARQMALQRFLDGDAAYMSCTQVEPPVAHAKPLREKHLRKVGAVAPSADEESFHTAECFRGDAQEMVAPTGHFPGTRPAPVTRGQARALCRHFESSGQSNHSGQGATLWVVLEHCAVRGIAYHLSALPGVGYYVERARQTADSKTLSMAVESTYVGLPDAPGDAP